MRVKQLEALVVWDQALPSDQTKGVLWRAGDGGNRDREEKGRKITQGWFTALRKEGRQYYKSPVVLNWKLILAQLQVDSLIDPIRKKNIKPQLFSFNRRNSARLPPVQYIRWVVKLCVCLLDFTNHMSPRTTSLPNLVAALFLIIKCTLATTTTFLSPHSKAKHSSKPNIPTAHPTPPPFSIASAMQTWMFHCVPVHLGSKTLPSAGLQLNTIYLRQAWLSRALQGEIYMKNYSWWRENKREESGSAWFQPLLADDARVSWWRETQERVGVVHPRVCRDGMLLSLNSIWCLPGHQHTSYMSSNTVGCVIHTHTPLTQQTHTLLNTQNLHTLLLFIHSQTQRRHFWLCVGNENKKRAFYWMCLCVCADGALQCCDMLNLTWWVCESIVWLDTNNRLSHITVHVAWFQLSMNER